MLHHPIHRNTRPKGNHVGLVFYQERLCVVRPTFHARTTSYPPLVPYHHLLDAVTGKWQRDFSARNDWRYNSLGWVSFYPTETYFSSWDGQTACWFNVRPGWRPLDATDTTYLEYQQGRSLSLSVTQRSGPVHDFSLPCSKGSISLGHHAVAGVKVVRDETDGWDQRTYYGAVYDLSGKEIQCLRLPFRACYSAVAPDGLRVAYANQHEAVTFDLG